MPYDQAGAFYSRDALAKALYLSNSLLNAFSMTVHRYERLFTWLVDRINSSIHTNIQLNFFSEYLLNIINSSHIFQEESTRSLDC